MHVYSCPPESPTKNGPAGLLVFVSVNVERWLEYGCSPDLEVQEHHTWPGALPQQVEVLLEAGGQG